MPLALVVLAVLLASCADPAPRPTAEPPLNESRATTETNTAEIESELILAAGVFRLAAADSFESEGFHQVLEASASVPAGFTVPAGARLVLVLRDQSRPDQTCNREHPLSGCATVLHRASGDRALFLSETGVLAAAPDAYSPG